MKAILTVILFLFASLGAARAYVVTTAKGQKMEVTFEAWNDDTVSLRRSSGKRIIVPLSALSAKDRDYVKKNVKRDLGLARPVPARKFTLQDGREVALKLIGLRGMQVEVAGKDGQRVQVPLFRFSEQDQDFIIGNAPHLDALNANPSVRQDPLKVAAAVKRIDELLAGHYEKQGATPNPIVDDSTFLRRAYLGIIGRGPTADEVRGFLDDDSKDKRAVLIDHLFEHEGYVHHMFNYWADLLRIKTRLPGRNYGSAYYAQWMKDNLRENKPYDAMVREMLTAEGFYWDNPAVGFYRRDLNMPLDHMAVMCQTLLGTSIVCAQCHDHPFDSWTQKQYYEMAAYTFPMVTRLNTAENPNIRKVQAMVREEHGKKGVKKFNGETRAARQAMIDYPLRSGIKETGRRLRFPKEYAYDNAKPGQVVRPKTPFGESAQIADLKSDSTIDPFAEWFASPANPRFARNIANRLWKETFGLGMVEPVDDMRFTSKPFDPELMRYLETLMTELRFDLKTYQRILHRTQLFQRAAYAEDVNPVEGYPFTGPLLRRLSAEQLWDSVVAMIVPDVDRRVNPRLLQNDTAIALRGQETLKMPAQKIYAELKERQGMSRKEVQKAEMMAMKGKGAYPMAMMEGKNKPAKIDPAELKGLSKKERKRRIDAARRKNDPYHGFSGGYMRAAEIGSPAPGGHFLNMFGQSDREMTENDNQEASIPQVLTLMNDSAMLDYLMKNPRSVLTAEIDQQKSVRDKIDAIFLSTLSRPCSKKEWDAMKLDVIRDGDEGIKRILWAVLNSQSFRFME